jgi:hypothetical protein
VEALLTTIDGDTGALAATVSGSELQVDVVSSALPTGAATAAKQPALGTAGTSSADVITVQGRAAMTPLLVDGSGVTQPVSGTVGVTGVSTAAHQVTAQTSLSAIVTAVEILDNAISGNEMQVDVLTMPTVTVNAHAVTNAGTFAVQVDGNALTALQLIDDPVAVLGTATYTEASTKGTIIGAVRRDADTSLVDTTNEIAPLQVDALGRLKVEAFSGETLPVSLSSVPSHAVTNAGTFAVQVDGSALTALQKIDDPVLVDDAGFTPTSSSVMMAGFQADEASIDSVDEGDAGAARMTLDRKVIVTPQPHTAGGLAIHRSIDLDEGTLEVVKNSPGQVYGMWASNRSTSAKYIKFYDATSGTYGTGTPAMTVEIPGNASDHIAGVFNVGGMGITFATGICVGAGTGIADNDTGAPGANEVVVNIFYK